jgi:type IV pilus assembly protein PilC
MKRDEFAFFNDQLAAMLRHGIPLEGALRQLARGMRRGRLQDELQALEADLGRGTPLREAVAARRLPGVYARLLTAGAEGGDLPGLLTLAADHYRESANLAMRLKGVMVYPLLALITSLLVTVLLARMLGLAIDEHQAFADPRVRSDMGFWFAGLWLPPVFLAIATVAVVALLLVPAWRHALRWRLPGAIEASLSNLAGTITMLLKSGCRLPEAIQLCAGLEPARAVSRELREWDERLARGERELGIPSKKRGVFPPLFLWLISSDPEDRLTGFARAAEIYQRRARARLEILLYAALPVMVLFLGGVVLGQAVFAVRIIYAIGAGQLGGLEGIGG